MDKKYSALKLNAEETKVLVEPVFNVVRGKEEVASLFPFCFDSKNDELQLSPLGIINGILDSIVPTARIFVKINKDETSELVVRKPDEKGHCEL